MLIIAAAALILTFYFRRDILKNGMRRLGFSLALPGLTIMIAVLLARNFAGNVELPQIPRIESFFEEFVFVLLRRIMIGAVIVLGVGVFLIAISLYLKKEVGSEKLVEDKVVDNKSKKTTTAKETSEND